MIRRHCFILFAWLLLALSTPAFAQDAIGDDASFDYYDLRTQSTDQQGDLAISQFAGDENFFIASSVKFLQPVREDSEMDVFTTYTMTDEQGKEVQQIVHSSEEITPGQETVFHCFGLAVNLAKNQPVVFTIETRIVFEGESQTRTTKVTIAPRGVGGGKV